MRVNDPAIATPHLLIVDDNPDQLRLLVETLRSTNYRISVAFDGAQGYERALAALPDLILLDVRMPRMDGFALCRRLKANPSTAHIPVIFLSSASELNERLTGLRDGGVDYILKPYDSEEVLVRIQIHLNLSPKLTPVEADNERNIGNDEVLFNAAKRLLLANLSQTPRLEELAAQLGVNGKRLSRAFHKCTEMSVFEYLRYERMRLAERLLTETSLGMGAIAEELGFSSAANFSTAFREHTGLSPSDFRRGSTKSQH